MQGHILEHLRRILERSRNLLEQIDRILEHFHWILEKSRHLLEESEKILAYIPKYLKWTNEQKLAKIKEVKKLTLRFMLKVFS